MLAVGSATDNQTHYFDPTKRPKGCGRIVALCGQEVDPATIQPEGTAVTDSVCLHAFALGEHLLK